MIKINAVCIPREISSFALMYLWASLKIDQRFQSDNHAFHDRTKYQIKSWMKIIEEVKKIAMKMCLTISDDLVMHGNNQIMGEIFKDWV